MISATYVLVDLGAIKHNVYRIKEYAPQAKIMAVIKANAYGHGLLRIAEALEVDALAVARADEGIRLRRSGFKNRINILEGFVSAEELNNLAENDLEVVVHTESQIEILEKYQGQKKISAWIKLDTGMNRLGFKANEFVSNYQRLSFCKSINHPVSLMTHLACADEIASEMTLKQVSLFNELVTDSPGECSIANSAGIIAWTDSLTDWVRPGIMLYGVSPFSNRQGKDFELKPVMSLHSRLIAVKNLGSGEAVGYGGTWVSRKKTKLGVIAIGYGDGYPRYAKTGTPVLVNGKRVPLLGRVSMDMITVDLSTQPNAKPGDSVILWGEGLAVEEIAKNSNTIPYTLLCGITQRVEIQSKP